MTAVDGAYVAELRTQLVFKLILTRFPLSFVWVQNIAFHCSWYPAVLR